MVARLGDTITIGDVLERPFLLIGTVDEMADQLLRARDRYGFTYLTVHEFYLEALAPVIAAFALNQRHANGTCGMPILWPSKFSDGIPGPLVIHTSVGSPGPSQGRGPLEHGFCGTESRQSLWHSYAALSSLRDDTAKTTCPS